MLTNKMNPFDRLLQGLWTYRDRAPLVFYSSLTLQNLTVVILDIFKNATGLFIILFQNTVSPRILEPVERTVPEKESCALVSINGSI